MSQNGQYDREEVMQIINSVLLKIESKEEYSRENLLTALQDLRNTIQESRSLILDLQATDISNKYIPKATGELGAVVDATEQATGTIMDSCEVIETSAAEVGGEHGDKIQDAVIKIYEACSFQDITGQRITKVMGAFQEIEYKVARLLDLLQGKTDELLRQKESGELSGREAEQEAGLLCGPQLPGDGIDQNDIDAILAQFD